MAQHRRRPSDKRYVTARSTMQTVGVCVGALVMLCAGVTTLATHKCGDRGAATNRATIPTLARYGTHSNQRPAVATKPLCAGGHSAKPNMPYVRVPQSISDPRV